MSEMTRPRTETAEPAPAPPSRRPRWLVPAVAGAAAAAVAAVAFSGLLTPDPVPAPDTAAPAVTLAVPNLDPATSMCLAISPEVLAPAQLAFDGVVTRVDGDAATLTPSRWYRGERAGTVEVTVPPEVDAALVGAPRFELGKRYLVSGGDGQVGLCGASGEYSTQLESLYRTAFAG